MRGRTLASLVKLTVFAVVTALVTTVLAFTIAGGTPGGFPKTYRAAFTDVTNLMSGDDVRVAGVRVGQVDSIRIVGGDHAQVTFSVGDEVPVTTSTHAAVRYRNLIGQRYIDLTDAPGSATPLPRNGLIPLARTAPALDLTALFDGFRPLFKALTPQQVNQLSYEIIQTLQGEGGTVDSLLASTASLTNRLADRDKVIGQVVDNLENVLATVDARDSGLAELIDQLQRLTTGLAGDRQAIADSLGSISDLTGDTASLIAGIRPSLTPDLQQLSAVANTLATTKNPDGKNTLDATLKLYPNKLATLDRTVTYGSWFNFWLCDGDIFVNGSLVPFTSPALTTNDTACRTSG